MIAIPVDKLPVIETLDATISTRQGELLGVLYLDSHVPSSAFTDLDREVLRTLAREAATVIENARLFAASRAKQRLDHEIEIASQIQKQLLPKSLPDLPDVAVAGSTLSCHSVGGDCFDVIGLGGGRHGFFVGDISGKGVTAALLATLLQGVFFTTAAMDISLPGVFSRVNQYLCERSGEDRYATVFYGILDKMGRFEYVNAGHVPPLLKRKAGGLEGLGSANFPVGMFAEAEYQSARVQFEPGDFLVIYTDGVSEASNTRNELFEEVAAAQNCGRIFRGQRRRTWRRDPRRHARIHRGRRAIGRHHDPGDPVQGKRSDETRSRSARAQSACRLKRSSRSWRRSIRRAEPGELAAQMVCVLAAPGRFGRGASVARGEAGRRRCGRRAASCRSRTRRESKEFCNGKDSRRERTTDCTWVLGRGEHPVGMLEASAEGAAGSRRRADGWSFSGVMRKWRWKAASGVMR